RVETTGGGGWGDPLEREPELVALDALQGKISARAAREEYGVVLAGSDGKPHAGGALPDDDTPQVDAAATRVLRDGQRRARRPAPFSDGGTAYRTRAGVDHAAIDFVESAGGG